MSDHFPIYACFHFKEEDVPKQYHKENNFNSMVPYYMMNILLIPVGWQLSLPSFIETLQFPHTSGTQCLNSGEISSKLLEPKKLKIKVLKNIFIKRILIIMRKEYNTKEMMWNWRNN